MSFLNIAKYSEGYHNFIMLMEEKSNYIPELLAPAGEPMAAYGAFSAGADAVYLGAAYSARAYAKNFTDEELIDVIHYAHLWKKKIYLASNILMKPEELSDAVRSIRPYYEAGLDGVIVQDLGLLKCLHEVYPNLPLHASTQMTILSTAGIQFLKEQNVQRVVPGRELSLRELEKLKQTGMEIEAFIHGAMCYSYSGKCLFSSLAGGRSGNRGRCAGPCRKMYFSDGQNGCYPLSMKDMHGLPALPGLLDARIDSFKIEGRMKDASYSAGVTEIYRKYIDAYLKDGELHVSQKDLNILAGLYQRSEKQTGYFDLYNGKEMISLKTPAYNKVDEMLVSKYREKYVNMPKKMPVSAIVFGCVSKPLRCDVICGQYSYSYEMQSAIEVANKESDVEANIKKHFEKFGDTPFICKELTVHASSNAFIPVSVIKELRRKVLEGLFEQILIQNMPYEPSVQAAGETKTSFVVNREERVRIGVTNCRQLKELCKLAYDFDIILPLFDISLDDMKLAFETGRNCFLRLPEIMRECNYTKIRKEFQEATARYSFTGYYAESIDGLAFLCDNVSKNDIICGNGLYAMNISSCALLLQKGYLLSVPYELHEKEFRKLPLGNMELLVYGYLPVMQSANCLQKTLAGCDVMQEKTIIKDESGREFTSLMHHALCYNTLYNCVPLYLKDYLNKDHKEKLFGSFRLDFSIETEKEIREVLNAFFDGGMKNFAHTTGHVKRGVL